MNSQAPQAITNLPGSLQDFGEPGDLIATLRRVATMAWQRFSADGWMIFALNPITGQFVSSAAFGEDQGEEIDATTLAGLQQTELLNRVINQDLPVVEDLKAMPEDMQAFAGLKDVRSFVAMVLKTNQAQYPLAILYLHFRKPRTSSPTDKERLHLFTGQAATMLQNTWLLYRFQEATRLGREINQTLNTVESLFKTLQKRTANLLDTSQFLMLAIYQPPADKFDLYLSEQGQYRVLPDNELNGGYQWVLQKQNPLVIPHLSAQADRLPVEFEDIPGTDFRDRESLVFVPLVLYNLPLGLLSVQHAEADVYNTEDLNILTLLANHVVSVLSNLQLFDNLRQLNEIGQLLTRQLGSEEVLQNVVNRIQTTTQADLAILYSYDQASGQFQFRVVF